MKRSADPNSDKMRAEFRQKLENYEAAPSQNLWDKIELGLDKEEALVYKNRFRIYSRLAAACLLLLLAFSAVFIPNKLKQLKDENTGIAAVQSPENDQSAGTAEQQSSAELSLQDPQPENSTSEIALTKPDKIAENGMVPAAKTARNAIISNQKTRQNGRLSGGKTAPFNSGENPATSTRQTSEIPKTAKTEPKNTFTSEINSPEKTVAFNAPKVDLNVPQPAWPETSGNAMVPAAKTARATQPTAVDPISSETQNPTSETSLAAIAATEIPAPEADLHPEIASSESKTAEVSGKKENENQAATLSKDPAFGKAPEPAVASTFSPENRSVLTEKTTASPLAFLKIQSPELQKAETEKFMLPDSNALVLWPKKQEITEISTVSEEKTAGRNKKWQLMAAFSGRGFKTGMQLASQATVQPSSISSNIEYQQQQIAEYQVAIQEFNENTKATFSEGGTLKIGFNFSENWMLQTGITYLKHRAQTTSHYAFFTPKYGGPTTSPGIAPGPGEVETTLLTVLENNFKPGKTRILKTEASQTNYTFQQIGVPLNLRFQTVSPKLYYFGAAGFSMNKVKTISVEHETEKVTLTPVSAAARLYAPTGPNPKNFRKWLPAVNLQAGLGYHLSERWQLELALEGEHYLKPLIQADKQAGAKQNNPLSVGVSLQLGFGF